jgi:hypothetical protein
MLVGIGFVALLTAAAAQRFVRQGDAAPSGEAEQGSGATLQAIDRRLARIERLLAREPCREAEVSARSEDGGG